MELVVMQPKKTSFTACAGIPLAATPETTFTCAALLHMNLSWKPLNKIPDGSIPRPQSLLTSLHPTPKLKYKQPSCAAESMGCK
ncbi:hypothetical protein RJ639_046313 [Escallonia herrerae]|uniref:Uncharacterized protein n=1 Tax=Escallonia herrerae TaxID=1293975 RepID=A0AA88W6S1_9ASTE|nr:hypothetical protein RJ639_046313 [Escallonia herrerae]